MLHCLWVLALVLCRALLAQMYLSDVFVGCILQILLHCRICNWWHLKNGDFHVDSVM